MAQSLTAAEAGAQLIDRTESKKVKRRGGTEENSLVGTCCSEILPGSSLAKAGDLRLVRFVHAGLQTGQKAVERGMGLQD